MAPNVNSLPVFGICPRCGRTGLDSDGARLTGYVLIEYQGEDMCTLCKIELEDKEHDEGANERRIEEEKFRNEIGMKHTVQ